MIDARQGDGRFGPSQFVPNASPGFFDPVAPNGTIALDPTPWVGGVEPFLMQSSSQFRSAGPLALTSAAYAAEFNEVKMLGGDGVVTPSARTATQTYIAKWWQSNPVASWNDVARQLIARNHLDAADKQRRDAQQGTARPANQHRDPQVPLRLRAAFPGDPQGGGRRQPRDLARSNVDAAARGALPRSRVGASRARQFVHHRAAGVLRQRTCRRLPDHELRRQSRRRCYAFVQQLLAGGRRDRRSPPLGGSPFPHRGRAGRKARHERREFRDGELPPAGGLTPKRQGTSPLRAD